MRRAPAARFVDAADEKLSGKGNVDADVGVHGMLAQKIDSELFSCLSETEEAIKGEDICEKAAPKVKMHHIEELQRHFLRWRPELAIKCCMVIVVHAYMLMMKCSVEDVTTQARSNEHAMNEGLEFDKAMIETVRNRATKLKLIRFKAVTARLVSPPHNSGRMALTCISPPFPFGLAAWFQQSYQSWRRNAGSSTGDRQCTPSDSRFR